MTDEIALTWPEILLATNVGIMRRVNALRNEREEPYGARPKASWNDDINGALAELAVAKAFNLFWSGTVGILTLPDVGPLQVRSKIDPEHRLVILQSDVQKYPDKIFISVLVDIPVCRLCGWSTPAVAAAHPQWILKDPSFPDRYFVPNSELLPILKLRHFEFRGEKSA